MWGNNLTWILYVVVVIDIESIRERFSAVAPFLDERGRRLVAAAEAFAAGYGGITAVAMATGVAPSTIGRGLKELAQDERIRRPGAGRKRTISKSLPSRKRGIRHCSRISRRWSSRRHAVIPSRRCGGPARACAAWRRRCKACPSEGWGRVQQRLAGAAVETRTPGAGQRARPRHHGQPPAAPHQQGEKNRTPPLLLHQAKL